MSASITFLGHATFQLTLPDERLVFIDPWFEGNPSCPDSFKKPARCDLVVLTHGHDDHVGGVEALIEAHNPKIVANYDLCMVMGAKLGGGRYCPMNTGGTQDVDGVRVSLTQAFHGSALSGSDGLVYGGMPNGAIIAVDGLAKIYHAGDTDVFSDMQLIAKLFAPDIAILPIGDLFTMGAKGAAVAAEFLDPKVIIPCHYKTFPILAQSADAFQAELGPDPGRGMRELVSGEPVEWTADGIR